jgi:hypothetical protein
MVANRRGVAPVLLAALAGCSLGSGLGGPGAPAQLDGEAYPGPRAPVAGTVQGEDSGCLEIETDGLARFVIWPAGTQLADGGIRLPDGTVVRPGSRVEGIGAVTPIERLVADPNGYWAHVIGFCAPAEDEALVLDQVGVADR